MDVRRGKKSREVVKTAASHVATNWVSKCVTGSHNFIYHINKNCFYRVYDVVDKILELFFVGLKRILGKKLHFYLKVFAK